MMMMMMVMMMDDNETFKENLQLGSHLLQRSSNKSEKG